MKTVYLVQTQTYLFRSGKAYDSVWRTIGIYTNRDCAEKVAESYDDLITNGHVIDVQLNKEYDNL